MAHEIYIGEGGDVGAEEVIEEIQGLSQPLYIKVIDLYVVIDTKSIPDDYQLQN